MTRNDCKCISSNKGLTVLESLIALAIIAVLLALMLPAYREHVLQQRRSDAQAALVELAAAMERQYVLRNTYCDLGGADGADVCGEGPLAVNDTGAPNFFATQAPLNDTVKYYDLRIDAVDPGSYTLAARPIPGTDQENDICAELTLTHDGVKQAKDSSGNLISIKGWSDTNSSGTQE